MSPACDTTATALSGPVPVEERCTLAANHPGDCVGPSGFAMPRRRSARPPERPLAPHARQLVERAYDGPLDEVDQLALLQRLVPGNWLDLCTFDQLRVVAAAMRLCGWDILPHQWAARQLNRLFERGEVPMFRRSDERPFYPRPKKQGGAS